MRSILRNRTLLIALALLVLVGVRLVPQQVSGPGGPSSSGPPGSTVGAPKTGSQGRPGAPTATPAVIDPQQIQDQTSPLLLLRAATVKRGAQLAVSGQAFRPYQELVISIQRQGENTAQELGTVTTDKNGYLPDVSLSLPEGIAPGPYTVIATPALGGPSVEASLRVEGDQTWARLTSEASKPNGAVGYEGGGFTPGERVRLHLDNLSTPPAAVAEASEYGEISGVFRVPMADEGDHTIVFYGEEGKTPALTSLFVLGFHPWVVLDNYSPLPEQAVGFAGSDFTPGEKVFVFLNSLESAPMAVVQVGEDGTFQAPGAIPLAPGLKGEHTLLFVGSQSQTTTEAEFEIQPYPASLELTSYAGPPGSEVTFVGNGFSRGEEILAYWGEPGTGSLVSTFHADDKGTFSGAGSFRVPRNVRGGNVTLTVVGQVSEAEASVTYAVLPITPWAEVKQDEEGRLLVTGRGFAPGEKVELRLGRASDPAGATSDADEGGNAGFEPLDIPAEREGAVPILLRGVESGGQAEVEFYPSAAPERGEQPQDRGSLEFEPAPTQTEEGGDGAGQSGR